LPESEGSDNDHKIFDNGSDAGSTNFNNNTTYQRERPNEPIKSLVGEELNHIDLVNMDLSEEQVKLMISSDIVL